MKKRILLIVLGILIAAQLVQPDRSVPRSDPSNDLLAITGASADIQKLVVGACYDCHSYQTDYPWWAYVTPVNFWIQSTINEAREKVNYARWDLFAGNEEAGESGESIAEGEMPPPNYAPMHGHAQLTQAQKEQLIAWFDGITGGQGEAGNEAEDDERD